MVENRVFSKISSIVALQLLLFLLFSVSYTNSLGEIPTKVIVKGVPTLECKPDVLTKGSSLNWINCFIELENADVSDIDITTVKLSTSLPGIIPADPSFFIVSDFDYDSFPDAQVRFNRTVADQLWFSSSPSPSVFTLTISGLVTGVPFSGTDAITIIKVPSTQFARYVQISSGNGGDYNELEGIKIGDYIPSSTSFSGYFLSRGDPKISGVNSFYSQGILEVEREINFIFFKFTFIEKQPITVGAFMNKYDNCFGNSATLEVSCDGNGTLLVHNSKTNATTKIPLNFMRYEIKNSLAKVEGGRFFSDQLSVENIPITNIRIR